jgi:hypothetical protein
MMIIIMGAVFHPAVSKVEIWRISV